jgi:DNA invertase Pin-like site-specific DNA recombinase
LKTDRPQLRRLLSEVAAGDVLMVTRLDRLARSTRDLLNTLAAIADRKSRFPIAWRHMGRHHHAHGRLMLTVLGGLAEFERELIRIRTGEGRARAKANGQSLGRKPKLTPHQQHEAIQRRDRGESNPLDCPQLQCEPKHDFTAHSMNATAKNSAKRSRRVPWWKTHQKLAFLFEKLLNPLEAAILHDTRQRDVVGILRQLDVGIIDQTAGVTQVKSFVEVQKRKKKIGVEDFGSWDYKRRTLNAGEITIISEIGFSAPVLAHVIAPANQPVDVVIGQAGSDDPRP